MTMKSSRPEPAIEPVLSTTRKINSNRSRYAPMEMTDDSVYNLAQHMYDQVEIADRFRITVAALMELHGDAYWSGRNNTRDQPRFQLARLIKAFSNLSDNDLLQKDVPVERMIKAIELHFKKYEGMGSTQTVVTKTEDKPSMADIRFVPLQADDEA